MTKRRWKRQPYRVEDIPERRGTKPFSLRNRFGEKANEDDGAMKVVEDVDVPPTNWKLSVPAIGNMNIGASSSLAAIRCQTIMRASSGVSASTQLTEGKAVKILKKRKRDEGKFTPETTAAKLARMEAIRKAAGYEERRWERPESRTSHDSGASQTQLRSEVEELWGRSLAMLVPEQYFPDIGANQPAEGDEAKRDDRDLKSRTWPAEILKEMWLFAKNTIRKKEVSGGGLGSLEVAEECVRYAAAQVEARLKSGRREAGIKLEKCIVATDVVKTRERWCQERRVKHNA